MQGTSLKFFMHENRNHQHTLVYEWLLEQAKKMGIHGGSAFKAIAGFGRHGIFHEEHFFELAGDLPVAVVFIVSNQEADRLLDMVSSSGLTLFYVRTLAEYGVINGEKSNGSRGENL